MESLKTLYDLNVQHTLDEKNHDLKKRAKIRKKKSIEGIEKATQICQNHKGNNNVFFSILKKMMYNFQK